MANTIFALVLFSLMLLLSLHNIFRYIIALKIRRKLIVIFYAATTATALLAVFLCSVTLVEPP